jgi:hypothetical protein
MREAFHKTPYNLVRTRREAVTASSGNSACSIILTPDGTADGPRFSSFAMTSCEMVESSTTLKWPAQSPREARSAVTRSATDFEEVCEMRRSTTPHDPFAPRRKTRSPKSLSKVMRRRSSASARSITLPSGEPGDASRIHKTSCPLRRNRMTQSSGMFSFAQSRMDEGHLAIAKTFSSFNRSWAYATHARICSAVIR